MQIWLHCIHQRIVLHTGRTIDQYFAIITSYLGSTAMRWLPRLNENNWLPNIKKQNGSLERKMFAGFFIIVVVDSRFWAKYLQLLFAMVFPDSGCDAVRIMLIQISIDWHSCRFVWNHFDPSLCVLFWKNFIYTYLFKRNSVLTFGG